MSERMQLIEDAMALVSKYTKTDDWRPGLVDIWVYNSLINMYESDYEESEPQWLWRKTPDEAMEHIISKGRIFDMEYGIDDLYEAIREYLQLEEFIVDPEDVSDEEYQANLEGHGITPNPANLKGE